MFPTTRWTLILAARNGDTARRAALESVAGTYWRPVYFYLRRKGLDATKAEDVTQSFFVHVIEGELLVRLDPARGRFRSYLLTSLDHYVVSLHEKEVAVKRGGRMAILPLDSVLLEAELPGVPEDPGRAFDREWALALLGRALGRLREEYAAGKRKGPAEPFLRFFRLDESPSYAEAAAECGLTTVQFKAALHRARDRFRQIVEEEVAATVADDADAGAEMRALRAALSA